MTKNTRRFLHCVLLTAGLTACASSQSQQRAEDPADLSATRAERDNASELGQLNPVNDEPGEPGINRPIAEGNEDAIASDTPGVVPGDTLPPVAPIEGERDASKVTSDRSDADNTGINKRDRKGNKLTASDQGTSDRDIEITRRIRETVVDDSSLSFTARNVKIITVDGRVTLRGPVASQNERTSIEKKALAVAGEGRVVNELEVK
jgi:osmotically-inducible protein OsmY